MTVGDGHQMESLEHIHGIWTCHKSARNTYNLKPGCYQLQKFRVQRSGKKSVVLLRADKNFLTMKRYKKKFPRTLCKATDEKYLCYIPAMKN